ncbi:Mfa1 family fimbria major subunit [uncultured Bacteroides sp.]|uniref:Mfa1 family fimbria major subunit n=1 Tax=uncultured Bacteroides sp. TaxID=162156 RepID=UPI0026019869|nr:Mfa1 family fimbria major subunit [uncultured Bacteroides sp.]
MGNLKYFSLLMVAGMFAACSDNLENPGNENDGPKTGEGYVKVAINLPTVNSSRAGEEPGFDDGDASEYKVNTGIIAFFEGAKDGTEDKAKFVKAYDLGNLTQTDDTDAGGTPDHISTTVTTILNVPKPAGDNKIYALAILNNGSTDKIVSVNSQGSQLTFHEDAGDYVIINAGDEFNTLMGAAWSVDAATVSGTAEGFLMLNSPLYKTEQSVKKIQTLVPVIVHDTEPDEGTTADKIFVERIVAKVDLELPTSTSDGKYTIPDGAYAGSEVIFTEAGSDLGWVLNVTNKTTKPVRDVSNYNTWSTTNSSYFFGTSAVDGVQGSWSRIYWAKDNNYDKSYLNDSNEPDLEKVNADFNVYSMDDETAADGSKIKWGPYSTTGTSAKVNAQYCLENTDVAVLTTGNVLNLNEYNITSVLIKTKFNIKKTGETDKDYSFFTIGDLANTYTKDQFLDYVAEKCNITTSPHGLTINSEAKAGYYEGADQLKTLINGFSDDNHNEALNNLGKVAYYLDGDCYYYAAPIQHFELTKPTGNITNDNYLGKYGVVRNNWYNIKINKVSAPGLPEITDPEEPVEKEEGYIKCEINVLSWAKRSQGVDL